MSKKISGWAAGLLTCCAAVCAEEKSLLIFGNSYSHFFEYLPGIARSKGDVAEVFPMRNSNAIADLFAAEENISRGGIQAVSEEEAGKLKKDELTAVAWSGMENKDNRLYRMKEVLDSKAWNWASFQPHSSWANNKEKTLAIIAPATAWLRKNYPDIRPVYFHPTQYRNDELVFKKAINASCYSRARKGYPYTEDQHYFDALQVALAVGKELDIPVIPAGTALQNARYDREWGEVTPVPGFDYLNATEPSKPDIPKPLHYGFAWRSQKTSRSSWVIDSHPNFNMNYLNACLWYEFMFGKSPVGATVASGGKGTVSESDAKILQRIAHETMKGRLPPLRLQHPESRIVYGDLLLARSEELAASGDPEREILALDCLQTLFAYIPEHPKVSVARQALEKSGKLEEAQALADTELKERPVREAFLRKCWEGEGALKIRDDKKEGRWEDL